MVLESTDINKPFSNIRLWNPKYFVVLSPIFSFLLPGILFSMNIGQLGDRKKQKIYIAGFIISLVLFMFCFYLMPDDWGNIPKYIGEAVNIAIGSYLYKLQKSDYENWKLSGQKNKSFLLPVIISIIPVIAIIGFLIYANKFERSEYKEKEDVIFYDKGIPLNDVKILYKGLEDWGVFEVDEKVFSGLMIDEGKQYGFGWSYKEGIVFDKSIEAMKENFEEFFNSNYKMKKRIEFIPLDSNYERMKK
jgi:hypothetical protein